MESIGIVIAKLRKEAGLQQKYVALSAKIDPATYSLIENGKKPVTDSQLEAISTSLDLKAWQIGEKWIESLKQSPADPLKRSPSYDQSLAFQVQHQPATVPS